MLGTPFSPWPSYSEEEVEAVARVLRSGRVNYWTGEECREFEREFAAWTGSRHAVALANGTVALDAALKALGVGAGDEVVVTPRSFFASVSSVVTVGAVPVFADVDADSGNITVQSISRVLTSRTRAIVCVHLAGWPCDMPGIMALAAKHDLRVIEDCAQAHGARIGDRMVGTFGHIGTWSFCQDKIMTTGGEGGMITTNERDLWSRVWSYKDHGKSWQAVYEKQHPPGFRWLSESFGTNGRMLETQAVLGRIQLRRLSEWTARRTAIAQAISAAAIKSMVLRVPMTGTGLTHAYYRLYAYVRTEHLRSGWDRDRIASELVGRGVPCYHGTCSEIYLEKAFDGTPWRPEKRLPVARALGETSLMFLVHPTLKDSEVAKTCQALEAVLAQAKR